MQSIGQWLGEYSQSHQNPTNKKIHHICVPLIMFSLLGLLWHIPSPQFFHPLPGPNWAILFYLLALMGFYARLGSFRAFALMTFLGLGMLTPMYLIDIDLMIHILIFVFAWVGQFVGHKIEGKKPSFFKDLQFLLVGPLWVFSKVL